MRKSFSLEKLNKIRDFDARERYCGKSLMYLGDGCTREAFQLSATTVLKLARDKAACKNNILEKEIYDECPAQHKNDLLKIYFCHPKGWYLICERVKTYHDNFPKFDPYLADGYYEGMWDVRGHQLPKTTRQWTQFSKLNDTVNWLKKNYGLQDLCGCDNWGSRKSGKYVIIDYSE